jgi:predicted Zn-dependent protease
MCARNPVTGKKELSLMSESQEIAMGKSHDPAIIAEYGVYENPNYASLYHRERQTNGCHIS